MKYDTVTGIIGNTHGVSSDSAPMRMASFRKLPRSCCWPDAAAEAGVAGEGGGAVGPAVGAAPTGASTVVGAAAAAPPGAGATGSVVGATTVEPPGWRSTLDARVPAAAAGAATRLTPAGTATAAVMVTVRGSVHDVSLHAWNRAATASACDPAPTPALTLTGTRNTACVS